MGARPSASLRVNLPSGQDAEEQGDAEGAGSCPARGGGPPQAVEGGLPRSAAPADEPPPSAAAPPPPPHAWGGRPSPCPLPSPGRPSARSAGIQPRPKGLEGVLSGLDMTALPLGGGRGAFQVCQVGGCRKGVDIFRRGLANAFLNWRKKVRTLYRTSGAWWFRDRRADRHSRERGLETWVNTLFPQSPRQ